MLTNEDIKKIAELSRLSLSDEDCELYTKQFKEILSYIDTIESVEVENTEPSKLQYVIKNVTREDDQCYEAGVFTDDILKVAPHTENGYFKVNKIL